MARLSKERVKEIFSSFGGVIRKVATNAKQVSEALSFWVKTRKEFPFSDVLHSVIARDNCARLVCRDRHLFEINLEGEWETLAF